MLRYGVGSICRAGGTEPAAVSQPGADNYLIEPDQCDEDGAHCSPSLRKWACRLALIAAAGFSAAPGLAITTRSTPGSPDAWWRNVSRMSRFTRLRRTALPVLRAEIAIPRRGQPRSLLRPSTVNSPSADRAALSKTRWKSAACTSRRLAGNPCPLRDKGARLRERAWPDSCAGAGL